MDEEDMPLEKGNNKVSRKKTVDALVESVLC